FQENQSGTAEITIEATSNGQTVTDTFTVTVNAVDDLPVITPAQTFSYQENQIAGFEVGTV
ncbi:hypothetical protein, partial [Crocosphaera sp. XPORK-15E]|uniref:hypothetical protein n=1 Tax=Crocosphaera sp. XPORK-15E TaxID=3110247 RepID=UPI002B1F1E6F